MLRLPDTGQTQSFTPIFGEDADFEQNPPFFIVHGDGTVTDTITGLMWQQVDGGEMTLEAAALYCQNLTLGGYDDWRLPEAQEAFSILNHGRQNPPFDPAVFPDSGAEYWWTSELQVGNSSKVWVSNAGGGIGNHPKIETISAGGTKKFHVRAVRQVGAPELVAGQFVQMGNRIMDNLSGLEWTRFAAPDSMDWEHALAYAEGLKWEGYTDWRLPNIKELESLNDELRSQPSLNPNFFTGIATDRFWASTSLPNQPAQAWFMDTRFGVVSHESKTAKNYVLCVRGTSGATTAIPISGFMNRRVFPNPFSTKIGVENALNPIEEWSLFDGYGRLVASGEELSSKDFSALPPGMYFLRLGGKVGVVVQLIKI